MAPLFQGFFVATLPEASSPGEAPSSLCCKLERKAPGGDGSGAPPRLLLDGSCDTTLGGFCFPLGKGTVQEWKLQPPQEFAFTLTGSMGERLNGFCIVSWASADHPQVFCLLSSHCYFALFSQILHTARDLLGAIPGGAPAFLPPDAPLAQFLMDVSMQCPQLPAPMGVFTAQGRELHLPGDIGNGHWNSGAPVASVFDFLSPSVVMDVVCAILMERRVLFVASRLSSLSRTVHAMAALIYPFRWQHIFLPVVPEGLLDYLQAPMPWIVGLPRHLLPHLAKMELEDAVVVNLETGKVKMSEAAIEDASRFPWRERLYDQMNRVLEAMDRQSAPGYPGAGGGGFDPMEESREPDAETLADVLLASVMRDFFLRVLGSYRYFVHSTSHAGRPSRHSGEQHALQEGDRWFDHDSFQSAQRSGRVRRLLGGMRGSQIYEVFIRERLALAADGFVNTANDIFEADVAALALSGGFGQKRFSVMKLQNLSSSLMSHLKAFHHERRHSGIAKSAFKSGIERMKSLPSALMQHPSDGTGGDYWKPSSFTLSSPTQLQQKVSGAGKKVSRAAASMSGRMRKHASKLEGLMRNGIPRRTDPGGLQEPPTGRPSWASERSADNSEDDLGHGSDTDYRFRISAGEQSADSSPGPGSPLARRDSFDDGENTRTDTFDFPFQMRASDINVSHGGHSRSDSLASVSSFGLTERRSDATKSLEALFGESLALGESGATGSAMPQSPLRDASQLDPQALLVSRGEDGVLMSHRVEDPFEGLSSSCSNFSLAAESSNTGVAALPPPSSSLGAALDPFAELCAPPAASSEAQGTPAHSSPISLLDI